MSQFRLTVVVPTRNRPRSLLRLLQSISKQTLPTSDVEVIVVDDGSQPALDAPIIGEGVRFPVRFIRRTTEPSAHESRFAGLREARGGRVLFLDDDLVLDPEVLAEHAGVEDVFAVGPILYHPDAGTTAYQRFQAKRYADYACLAARQGSISFAEIYICNASGPTDLYTEVFEGVRELVPGTAVPGDGLDEELLCYQLRDRNDQARFLLKALVWHVDTKTVGEAVREKRHRGTIQCRLLLHSPELRRVFPQFAANYSKRRVRLLWTAPRLYRLVANVFAWVADHLPARWVPIWTCYPPMAIAYWDGINSVVPSYEQLRAVLGEQSD